MQLYSFFNSSTSYRVRIALALKGLPYDTVPVNIRAGEHRADAYVGQVNPSASVPAWVEGDARLIPREPLQRARMLELVNAIACDIHPVNNLRVLRYLQEVLKVTPEQKDAWYRHWIDEGLATVERLLARYGRGPWCFGDAPTLADVTLVPQIANALRAGCPLDRFERAMAVYAHAITHPAFMDAAPARQPDFTA
jgi:maleylacetoacetate isomerase